MSEESPNTPETDQPADAEAPTQQMMGGEPGASRGGRATITVERRWAIAVLGTMTALLLLLAVALVIEADGDSAPPFAGERAFPSAPGGPGGGGPGFERPGPPFGGGGPPQFDGERPPGFGGDPAPEPDDSEGGGSGQS